jgi:hypothetical protein
VLGELRRLRNENLVPFIVLCKVGHIKQNEMYVACVLEMIFAYEILVENISREDVKRKV